MKLFRRSDSQAPPVLHPALGSARAAAALPSATTGDVQQMARAYADVPLGERTLVLQPLCDALPREAVRRWTYDAPGEALAWAVLGAQTADAAAEARGDDLAANTAQDRMLAFERLMADARSHLLRSVELDDRDPGPWYQLLVTCYAIGDQALQADLAELRSRSPFDVEGLRLALDLLGEKWFGEPGQARSLAEEVSATAPDGSEAHVVTAFLLRDEWFYTHRFQNDARGADRVLQSPQSRRALSEAMDRSVRSASHVPTETTLLVRNHFAHVASLAGDDAAAKEQFDALDGTVTRWPWALFGDPVEGYAAARRKAS